MPDGPWLPTQYNEFHNEAEHLDFTITGDGTTNELIPTQGTGLGIVVVHYALTSNGGGVFQFTENGGGTALSGAFAIIDTFAVGQSFQFCPGFCPHGLFRTSSGGNLELIYTGSVSIETMAGHMTYLVVPIL